MKSPGARCRTLPSISMAMVPALTKVIRYSSCLWAGLLVPGGNSILNVCTLHPSILIASLPFSVAGKNRFPSKLSANPGKTIFVMCSIFLGTRGLRSQPRGFVLRLCRAQMEDILLHPLQHRSKQVFLNQEPF